MRRYRSVHFALVTFPCGIPCDIVLRMLSTDCCMHSHTEFAVGFWLVIATSFTLHSWRRNSWNSYPVNSPLLSWTHHIGEGYLAIQLVQICLLCVATFRSQYWLFLPSLSHCLRMWVYWICRAYLLLGLSMDLWGRLPLLQIVVLLILILVIAI